MKIITAFMILVFLIITNIGIGQSNLKIRTCTKVILNPADASFPPGYSDAVLEQIMDDMNQLVYAYNRGIEFENIAIDYIGGVNNPLSNAFYSVNVGSQRDDLELAAEADPDNYKWRNDCINIYINGYDRGLAGACSFTSFIADEIIFLRSPAGLSAPTFLHEIGHFFDLRHTHNGSEPDSCSGDPADWIPGNDLIDDTIADHNCWDSLDQMSQNEYGKDFDEMTGPNRIKKVEQTFFNIMSYHDIQYELTELQLDKIADMFHDFNNRADVASGKPYFVDDNSACGISCNGHSDLEYPNVDLALLNVNQNGDDIIVIRAGEYEMINKVLDTPVFLTATRVGDVLLK